MSTPIFPSVGEDGKIRENHLPDRLSDEEIAKALGQYRGTGFPDGLAAPVGSIYTDTDATNGAIRWIKASGGPGTTGWEVEYGKVERAVNGLLINGWELEVSGWPIRLTRHGDVVELKGYLNHVEGPATDNTVMSVPDGFRPRNTYRAHGIVSGTSRTTTDHLRIATNVTIRGYDTMQSQIYLHAIWKTVDPWPTILPGTPG